MNSRNVLRIFVGCFLAFALAAAFTAGPAAAAKKIRVALGNNGPQNDMGWYDRGIPGRAAAQEGPRRG